MNEGERVRLRTDVPGDVRGRVIPAGTVGVVVDVYHDPEAFAVDVTVDGEPDNIYLAADQVEPVLT